MEPFHVSGDDLLDDLTGPVEPEAAGRVVILEGGPRPDRAGDLVRAQQRLATLPCVIVAAIALDLADVVASGDAVADIHATVAQAPIASCALALHLRAAERRPTLDGLVAESALFSALQAGPEHAAWRARHRPRARAPEEALLHVERTGDVLTITLARPDVRNAVSAALRDQLAAALAVALADPGLDVEVCGAGPDFCAGGDLDEFGTTPDPATGHLIRTRRSVAATLHRLASRTTVHLHGAAIGAGIELAAFAGTIIAAPDTRIALPEVGLGLVPGAGGTVSLPHRIGRQRTAWLALTRRQIDPSTALAWGLVDRVT